MSDEPMGYYTIEPRGAVADMVVDAFDDLADGGVGSVPRLANSIWNAHVDDPVDFAEVVMGVLTCVEGAVQHGAKQNDIDLASTDVQAGFMAKHLDEDGKVVDVDDGAVIVTALRCVSTFINGDMDTLTLVIQVALERGPEYCLELLVDLIGVMRAMILSNLGRED